MKDLDNKSRNTGEKKQSEEERGLKIRMFLHPSTSEYILNFYSALLLLARKCLSLAIMTE